MRAIAKVTVTARLGDVFIIKGKEYDVDYYDYGCCNPDIAMLIVNNPENSLTGKCRSCGHDAEDNTIPETYFNILNGEWQAEIESIIEKCRIGEKDYREGKYIPFEQLEKELS